MQKRRNKIKIKLKIPLIILIFIALLFLIYSSAVFWKGFHNLDLGQNMRFLESQLNINLLDEDANGILRTGKELFILGVTQIEYAFFGLIVFSLILGFLLGVIWLKK